MFWVNWRAAGINFENCEKMIFDYHIFTLDNILTQLAGSFKVALTNNGLQYPEDTCKGYVKGLHLPAGIDVMFSEYEYRRDVFFQHHAGSEEAFMLWFDISDPETKPVIHLQKEGTETLARDMNALLLSNHFYFSNLRKKGARGYSCALFIPQQILMQLCKPAEWGNMLQWYFDLHTASLNIVKITEAEKTMLDGIREAITDGRNLFDMERRVFQLMEMYFVRIYLAYRENGSTPQISSEEAAFLGRLDELVLAHCMGDALDDDSLERETGFTRQAMDKTVRKVFHQPLTDYIRQVKLQKAYYWLTSGDKGIQDIAYDLGYANPSNFSSAFKKQYGFNPSETKTRQRL